MPLNLSEYAEGHAKFREFYFKQHEKEFCRLVREGQSPKSFFIGCSDSRVIPSLITNTGPGDLFIHRNIGNLVPPSTDSMRYHGFGAALEFALLVLGVEEIIVCGHSHCGACQYLKTGVASEELPHVAEWLKLAEPVLEMAKTIVDPTSDADKQRRDLERLSVLHQLRNLLTYDIVRERVDAGKLHLHGWYYYLDSGLVEYYDAEDFGFHPLENQPEQ